MTAIADRGVAAGSTDSVHEAVTRLRAGEMVAIVDDTGGTGRCDLVSLAHTLTVTQTAFLVRHTAGFLQVALDDERCDELLLPPLFPGVDRLSAQQCVGVDAARGISTGISAADRTRTINLLGSPTTGPQDLTRPGHVTPIRVSLADHHRDPAVVAHMLASLSGASAAVFSTLVGHRTNDLDGLMTSAELACDPDFAGLMSVGHSQVVG